MARHYTRRISPSWSVKAKGTESSETIATDGLGDATVSTVDFAASAVKAPSGVKAAISTAVTPQQETRESTALCPLPRTEVVSTKQSSRKYANKYPSTWKLPKKESETTLRSTVDYPSCNSHILDRSKYQAPPPPMTHAVPWADWKTADAGPPDAPRIGAAVPVGRSSQTLPTPMSDSSKNSASVGGDVPARAPHVSPCYSAGSVG